MFLNDCQHTEENIILVFFFQAEYGIRDPLVTGVQTCALPISRLDDAGLVGGNASTELPRYREWSMEIGRASCRERVEISVVAVSLKKKNNGREGWCGGRGGEDYRIKVGIGREEVG